MTFDESMDEVYQALDRENYDVASAHALTACAEALGRIADLADKWLLDPNNEINNLRQKLNTRYVLPHMVQHES
jgi:hypothetical protein